MNLAGDPELAPGAAGLGHDALDGDHVGVDQGGQDGGDGALDVAYLDGPGVEDLDGVLVVGVQGLADEAHHLAAADGAGVVAEADDVGDDEAEEVRFGGGRLRGGGRRRLGALRSDGGLVVWFAELPVKVLQKVAGKVPHG